jgi:hypothetical protein
MSLSTLSVEIAHADTEGADRLHGRPVGQVRTQIDAQLRNSALASSYPPSGLISSHPLGHLEQTYLLIN